MFPALRPLLNKGGAGRYISRAESVERLRPIAERHLDLLYGYDRALATMPDGAAKEQVEAMMPYLRTEVAKVSETILSLGGAPPTGVGRDPQGRRSQPVGRGAAGDRTLRQQVEDLLGGEREFGGALRDEADAVHHQERTRAILLHNAEASTSRADLLRAIAADLPR